MEVIMHVNVVNVSRPIFDHGASLHAVSPQCLVIANSNQMSSDRYKIDFKVKKVYNA
jgi:hypothetical protein